mmetsp:Transcript_27436/g.41756  ORF Transcript_27436/g.41756 Transcript_27436/m.41756 type:complete len:500 (+) Transcript_27436:59-1558(+)
MTPILSEYKYKPLTSGKHRTIDDFYEEAHSHEPGKYIQRLGYLVIFASLGLANTGDSAEIGSMGFLLANQDFRDEVVQGKDGIVASATYFGMLFGGLCCGPVCDRMGRRNILVGGLALNATAGILMAFTSTPYELILCRFLLGLGIGMIVTCLLALTSEHAPSKSRGTYLNFVSSFWTIGAIWVAVLAYEMFGHGRETSWRIYCLVNAIPSATAFLLVLCFVPESARYLGLNGKYKEATKVVNNIAGSLGYVGDKMSEEELKAQFPPAKTYDEGFWATVKQSCKAYGNLFANSSTRSRIIVLQGLWFFTSFGTGTSLWIPRILSELVNDPYLFSLLYACGSVPGILLAGFLLDKMERTRLLTIGFALTTCTLACLAVVAASGTNSQIAILILVCLFHSCLCLLWSTLSIISAETFPTEIRSTAMGVCSATGRFAFVVMHNISPILVGNPPYLVALGSVAFGVGLIFSHFSQLPSQTGAPLKDVEAPLLANEHKTLLPRQ